MPPLGIEPTMSAGKRPQICALDRATTGTGKFPGYVEPKYSLHLQDPLYYVSLSHMNEIHTL